MLFVPLTSIPALLGPKKSSLSSVNVIVGVAAVVMLVESVGRFAGVVVLVVVAGDWMDVVVLVHAILCHTSVLGVVVIVVVVSVVVDVGSSVGELVGDVVGLLVGDDVTVVVELMV